MTTDRGMRTMVALSAVVLLAAALYFARSIFAPIACSLFVIAVVWPLQRALQVRLPKLLALTITVLATLLVIATLGSLIVWSFGRVGQWVISNAARFQTLYAQAVDWLEGHDIAVTTFAENVNLSSVVGTVQLLGKQVFGFVSFAIITFVFTVLGLLEVDIARRNLELVQGVRAGVSLGQAGADVAAKLQKYMLVRSLMSMLTGVVVWAFALMAGLELATAWGIITFVLNYIPFIGPLVATVFPTVFALAQFGSWRLAIVVFLGLNLIQFLIGSYLEPRIAGAALSISPFLILFSIFFWSFLWGIPGAFIGVPILIAVLTVCELHEQTKSAATLLSGRARQRKF